MPWQALRPISEQRLVGATTAELVPLDPPDLIRVVTACFGDNGLHKLMPVLAFTGLLAGLTVLESSSRCWRVHGLSQAEVLPGWPLLFGRAAKAGFSS